MNNQSGSYGQFVKIACSKEAKTLIQKALNEDNNWWLQMIFNGTTIAGNETDVLRGSLNKCFGKSIKICIYN